MLKPDWVIKNWDFLSTRYKLNYRPCAVERFITDTRAYTTGKFFGTQEFFDANRGFGSATKTGTQRLFLRPYIFARMPEGVEAVYIDASRYKFDTEGIITDFDSYELPIFIFTKN